MSSIKVSILVPIYNVSTYLSKCLDSLINQTLKDIEIICINDGSTDDSLAIIKHYSSKDQRIKIIDKVNTGYGHSMNCGLDKACGEYIGIVESDDFAEINMFQTLYDAAIKNKAQVVKSNYYMYRTSPEVEKKFNPEFDNIGYNEVFCPLDRKNIFRKRPCIWTAIYNRKFLKSKNIYFTETPGASFQDTSFNFKVWINATRVYLLNEAFLNYRIDNATSSVKSMTKLFCICDEYMEIEAFLNRNRDKKNELGGLFYALKYEGYRWNLDRLDDSVKPFFQKRMCVEFNCYLQEGYLKEQDLRPNDWKRLNELLKNEEQDKVMALKQVYASKTYKTGKAILWFPKKIKNLISR